MSATAGPPATRSPAPDATSACARCRGPLHDDQEWCLECGTARATVRRAPSWRIPVAVVAAVALLVLVGLAIALASLSGRANQSAPPPPQHSAPVAPKRTATHAKSGHHSRNRPIAAVAPGATAPPPPSPTDPSGGPESASIVAATDRASAPSAYPPSSTHPSGTSSSAATRRKVSVIAA